MQTYVGTKIIQAEPQNDPKHPDVHIPGYRVVYPDGYVSWSPKATFEECYRPVTEGEKAMIFVGK